MSLSNIDIIKKFEDKYWSNPTRRTSQTITPLEFELSADNELLLKQVDQLTQKCITELHRGKKYRIKTLSSIFSLDSFIIKRIIRRNSRILAIKRKISKTFSRHRKLEDVHIDFIGSCWLIQRATSYQFNRSRRSCWRTLMNKRYIWSYCEEGCFKRPSL